MAQDQHWLPWTSCPVTFQAGAATASVTIPHGNFSANVVASGHLTMTVKAVDGYDTDNATATVYVVSQEAPAVRVFFDQDSYRFGEDREDATAVLNAEAAPGMPRGTTVAFSMFSESGTAKANEDLALTAVTPVEITDDEDMPEMDLRLSADEIEEEGETSSVATVSITNGKIFATDQLVTFALGGTATQGVDYKVSPADADAMSSGHQVVLPAGSKSVKMTFTAQDDDVRDPDEEIRVSVAHGGHAIGNRSIRIRDRQPGPTLEVT